MDEQRFQKSLNVVEGMTHTCQMYDPVFAGGEVIFRRVNKRDSEVKHQINQQRTGVLRQKHRDPADLGSQVSEVEGCSGSHRQMLENILILQGFTLGIQTNGLSGRIPLRVALVEHGLDFSDSGIGLDLSIKQTHKH